MKLFFAILFTSLFTLGLYNIIVSVKNSEHQNVHYNTGQVIELGQCSKVDDESKCSFKFRDSSGVEQYSTSKTPVSVGQLVYQECWYEIEKGDQCYVNYTPSKN